MDDLSTRKSCKAKIENYFSLHFININTVDTLHILMTQGIQVNPITLNGDNTTLSL